MIYTHVAAVLIGAAVAGGGVWKVQEWRHDAKEKERLEAAQELRRNNERSADKASATYEKAKTLHVTKYEVITETVEKIVDRPVYRDTVCWDSDGMRALADAIGNPTPSSQPAGALPRPSQAK